MTSHLRAVLAAAMTSPGVTAGVLFDHHGRAIESASWAGGDVAGWGAVASQMLRQWAFVGADLGIGALRSVLVERQGGPTMITPMEDDVALLIVGDRSCRLGQIRLMARRAREEMGERDRVISPAEPGAPPDVPEHFGDLTGTIEEVPPNVPAHVTTGEVVLVGTHTFRLVTRLIAHLLQTKGVRSSSLRAYSPSSTIVDVVLEKGATLETMDRSGLEELSVERAEAAGTRLVLRAGRPLTMAETLMGNAR